MLTDSWAVANGLAEWSGTWKENEWKVGEKDVWGRSVWLDRSKCVKCVKTLVSHINVHLKEYLVEFSNQGDSMAHSMYSQSFLPAILVIAQWAH